MAKNVNISSKTKNSKKRVTTDKQIVRVKPKGEIKFHNKLDSTATLSFFDADDKDGTAINGFCKGKSGSSVTIGKGKMFKCVMTQPSDDYAYSVSAPGYEELDPIIIIEPQ